MAYIDGNEVLLDAVLHGEGGAVDVVQETGSSTTAVMSQKATTDALDTKLNNISYTSNNYRTVPVINIGDNKATYTVLTEKTVDWSLMFRVAGGRTKVGTPIEDDDATNKNFVEEAVGVWQSGYVQGANELILSVSGSGSGMWNGGTVHAAFYGTSGGEIVVHLYHSTDNIGIDGHCVGYLYYDKYSEPYMEYTPYATINGEVQDGSKINITCTVISSKI